MARTKAKAKAKRKSPTHREPTDEQAATELVMYIENTSDLSPDGPSGQGRSVLLNALRKWRKKTYDPALAVRLFEYLTEAGAKRYAKEFDSEKNWSTMFNPATRHEAAKQLEASFRSSVENGEYDHVDTRVGVGEVVEEHVDARGKTRLDKLRADLPPGYAIYTYSPGDGVTRYRFFKNASPKQDYFGPDNGIYTALGYAEAEAFASGLVSESGNHEARETRGLPNTFEVISGDGRVIGHISAALIEQAEIDLARGKRGGWYPPDATLRGQGWSAYKRGRVPARGRAKEVQAPRLDSFTQAYFDAALWSSIDDGGDPLDDNYSISDIAPETRAKMIADCADFQDRYADLLAAAENIDSGRAGHNFWLSRNGHGAGFFDDGLDELQEAAKSYGTFDLYVGDDGQIHGS
jgi:hypothetical protein